MKFVINGARRTVEFTPADEWSVRDVIDGRQVEADAARISPGAYSILLGGRSLEVTVEENPVTVCCCERRAANFRWKFSTRAPGGAGAAQGSSSKGASS